MDNMILHLPGKRWQVSLTVTFNFEAESSPSAEPMAVAAQLMSRLNSSEFFILGSHISVETEDGGDHKVAHFRDGDYEYLMEIFTAVPDLVSQYVTEVSPADRAAWEAPPGA